MPKEEIFLNKYYVFWIKEEFAYHYFYKNDILYRFLNAYQEKQKISNQKRLIDDYISQLKKIETSICSIIKD